MRDHAKWGRPFLATAAIVALAILLVSGVLTAPQLSAQSAGQTSTPQWQIDAGGKMAFEVASVKQDLKTSESYQSNIPLGPQDAFNPTGGLFSATSYPLITYMTFAYKLDSYQDQELSHALPKWASTDRYAIQARASGNPTKDQFRLMMQALLADRFKLVVHRETKQLPVLALLLDKPGKLGPHLQHHPADAPCPSTFSQPSGTGVPPTVDGGFPETCGSLIGWPVSGRVHGAGRNMEIQAMAEELTGALNGIDRPIVDQTGLVGKYDFAFEFKPQIDGPVPQGFEIDDSAPTFIEALKQQLGLKLESQTGLVDVLVIDHVEQPSPN